jgi:aryl-alcohol dehydrogenase-like predicted oxidoreductase
MLNRRQFIAASASAVTASMFAGAFAAESPDESKMLMRKIPSTGESIPAVGLGTFKAMMTSDLNEQTLAPLADTLKIFHDAGGLVVDTAPSYGNAETVIGILTEKLALNDKFFFATKVFERGGDADAVRSFERSLNLLKRKKLELMQCHNYTNWDTHLKTMRQWKDNGTFRLIGVTHYQDRAHAELERIIRRDKIDFLQINYSIAEPRSADRLLPTAKDLGVAVLINRPFAGGQMFAKVKNQPVADFVKPFASTWSQAFLKFVLGNDAVTCVIGATGKPDHMKDNVRAGQGRLPDAAECAQLSKLFA